MGELPNTTLNCGYHPTLLSTVKWVLTLQDTNPVFAPMVCTVRSLGTAEEIGVCEGIGGGEEVGEEETDRDDVVVVVVDMTEEVILVEVGVAVTGVGVAMAAEVDTVPIMVPAWYDITYVRITIL